MRAVTTYRRYIGYGVAVSRGIPGALGCVRKLCGAASTRGLHTTGAATVFTVHGLAMQWLTAAA